MTSNENAVNNRDSAMVTVIPDDLKKLARLVVRGFYSREDILIIDMLVRHHCMREDDISNLLKFDKKLVRAKVAGLKKDKLIQEKQRMETRTDDPSKVEKMNCYFINYKIFVNVVKYKLSHMLTKLETSERDAASRSSFKCNSCMKTYTDLEVIELIDNFTTGDMKCNHCGSVVMEDEAAGPQSDSRQSLAKFNQQMEILFKILQSVENIKLDPSVLEPEPVDFGDENGEKRVQAAAKMPEGGGKWSGEATRGQGLRAEEQDIKIDFGDEQSKAKDVPKDVPIWITQSTVEGVEGLQTYSTDSNFGSSSELNAATQPQSSSANRLANEDDDEITRLLLQHEKRNSATAAAANSINAQEQSASDKSDDSDMEDVTIGVSGGKDKVDTMVSSDDDADGIPTVRVGNEEITLTDVNEDIINRMTAEEKERYTQTFQDFYSHMYD